VTLRAGAGEVSLHALVAESPRLTLLLMHGPARAPELSAVGAEIGRRWARSIVVRDLVLGTGEAEALGDPDGAIFTGWGVRGPELVLLRPDGHVAVRAPLSRAGALRAFATRWLGPPAPEAAT
jgi:hypothetical protein